MSLSDDLDNTGRLLSNGIFDITDIEVLVVCDYSINSWEEHYTKGMCKPEERDFFEKHHDTMVIANPYEVYGFYFLSRMPRKIERIGGFGVMSHGSSIILEDMPPRILIVADDD